MKRNSFVEGTIIATVAIVLVKILGMLYIIPFYATVGSQGSALYGYAYNIYNIFLEISAAGLPIAMSKIINEYNTLGMNEAKVRAFKIGKRLITYISLFCFVLLFVFAREIGMLIIGNLSGGNTVEDVAFVVRCVSFAVLIIPFLSVSKGYLQGHKYIGATSASLIIEQAVRILIIILGSYLAFKVFDLGLTNAVGVAVFGAFVGGALAYLYILRKMRKNKEKLGLIKYEKKDDVSSKEILKKIVSYAVPFIIINIAVTLYSFVNMVLILRTLNYLNIYTATEIEFITNSITTLGAKLNMIVGALATGLTVSLIPSIVSAFVKKDFVDVNNKINKAFQIVLIISIPMTLALSLMAKPVWTAFYGVSTLGPIIFRVSIFTALFSNLYMVSSSTLQGLNKFKAVYLSTLIGFFMNALLDIPLMLLMHKLGVYPFYGAILSTVIGYSLSVIIALKFLKKEDNISIKETYKMIPKILIPTILMVGTLIGLRYAISYNESSRLSSVIFILISTILGSFVYLFTAHKLNLTDQVFGKKMIAKIVRKLTFNKVKLKEG